MATRPDSRQVVLRSTQGMLGTSANDTLDTIFPKINDEIAKLFEDRNAMLQNGGLITFTGTQIDFTENLELAINSKIAGGAPTVISLGSTSRALSANGRMLYAVVDRSLGTATVTADATSLPAVTSSNQEVFLIAKRVDTSEGIQRLYWRNGMGQNAGQTLRLGASGTGSGSGLGDDLITTQFQASFTDEFEESATMSSSAVDSTKTNATYSAAKSLYQISYDATQTVSTSGTTATMSSAPSFTVVAGDMLVSGGVAKRIVTVTTQTSYVLESAFSSNLSSAACSVSQAVHTKDIYNTAFDGSAISSAFSTSFSEILVDYEDTSTVGDDIFDIGVAPVVGFVASNDNSSWSTVQVRPTLPLTQVSTLNLPTSGSALYIRLFANKSSGSGTVNVLKYKAYMQKTPSYSSGGVLNSALAFTNSVGTPINCSVGLSSGKTAITLTWTYPVGINPSTSNGALEVYLNGQKIPRYVDSVLTPDASYTEVSPTVILLDQNYSSLNISVEVVLPAVYIDQSSQNSTNISAQAEMVAEGFQGFVKNSSRLNATTTTGTPTTGNFHSTIINRASIVDITQDLRASLGVERIMTQQIYQLQNEFGPSGQPVWGAVNDDRGLIRFVGVGWTNNTNLTYGMGANFTTSGDYVEVTFYGTGLNFLIANGSGYAIDFRASVDGGAEGSNIMPATTALSGVIGARNYAPNQIVNVASGLALGVHTVKIRITSTLTWTVHGFEVLNTSSTTSINVNQGTSYVNGKKLTALTSTLSAYNSDFEPATALGINGGRVLVYQKSNGAIAKAVTPTNSAAAYLSSADHTNEEVARIYHPREFGAGRADDFSTLTTARAAVFTLDDGTTTLVGNNVVSEFRNGVDTIGLPTPTNFFTFTFVGTGIDIGLASSAVLVGTVTIIVDGNPVGTITTTTVGGSYVQKIASGLPYGTHTVKILFSAYTSGNCNFVKFITYQPKTPVLPENCVELSSYNVMANYSNGIVSGNIDAISTGILHKQSSREMTYVGTWSITAPSANVLGGQFVSSSTNLNYIEYTFFGTGLNIIAAGGTTTISIDGSLYTGLATPIGTGSSWTAGTSTWVGASVNGAGLIISGLTLGKHTVRIQLSSATVFYFHAIHIITPIHSPVPTVNYNQQNTLPIGSCSLSDSRKTSAIKEPYLQKKNIAQAVGVSFPVNTSSTTMVPVPDLSVIHTNTTGRIKISYVIDTYGASTTQTAQFQIYVDGSAVGQMKYGGSANETSQTDILIFSVAPGPHKIDVYWSVTGATSYSRNGRTLLVEEV